MSLTEFLKSTLNLDTNAISYEISSRLAEMYSDKGIVETDSSSFDFDDFVASDKCSAEYGDLAHNQLQYEWERPEDGPYHISRQAHYKVMWEGNSLDVIRIAWQTQHCGTTYSWIIAQTHDLALRFFSAVCEHSAIVKDFVYVFEDSYWQKSRPLYSAIQSATFDNLVLDDALVNELKSDLATFFESRQLYERYNLPWKRGILLLGTPGNGKTHTVKALLNWLGKPCFYVKSLQSQYGGEHHNIRQVFRLARLSTPCVLVMEDLDSLINKSNRAYFLNELDGFADNAGIMVVATTNHPERIDPAILDRPSRFDRKYHFECPSMELRMAYLSRWNSQIDPDMQVDEATISASSEATDGFSFAYLKELCVSSMMRWIGVIARNPSTTAPMAEIVTEQIALLKTQMSTMNDISDLPEEEDGEDDPASMFAGMMSRQYALRAARLRGRS